VVTLHQLTYSTRTLNPFFYRVHRSKIEATRLRGFWVIFRLNKLTVTNRDYYFINIYFTCLSIFLLSLKDNPSFNEIGVGAPSRRNESMGWPNRVTHRPTQDSSVEWPQERFMSKTKSTFTLFENPSIKKIICDHFYFFEYSMKKGDKKKSNLKLKLILEMSGNFNQHFSIKSQIKKPNFCDDMIRFNIRGKLNSSFA